MSAIVFLAYVAYVIDMGLTRPDSFWPPTLRQSESSGYNAVSALFAIGLPALWFALRRRRPRSAEDEVAISEADDELLTEDDEAAIEDPRPRA